MNKLIYGALTCCCLLLFASMNNVAVAQCSGGETELVLSSTTDNWGYECFWQITPQGNACNVGMIAEGGNGMQVGCNGGGDQVATTAQGYADNTTITESGICLTIGASYTLHYVDDYGDGGASFGLNLFGFDLLSYGGTGAGGTFNFTVVEPQAYDVSGIQVLSYSYVQPEAVDIRGKFFNNGSATITSLQMSFAVDGGTAVTGMVSGLNILPFTAFELSHPNTWNAASNGDHTVVVWMSQINGNGDMNTSNDQASRTIAVGPGIPDLLDSYLVFTPMPEAILSIGVADPRDLDFHPVLTRNELWVVLKSTENAGGKTVKISNAGNGNQTSLTQTDGNAWHFMSLPTGIAFSRNENFATSPGVFDANHDGGEAFTGPALWSSDPAIYAQPSGGNGSHLDMLHESPYSMGIAWEMGNKFWVTCGDHNEIMSFDFSDDHGPGNDYHGDGIIYKYPIPGYTEDPQHEVPDHLVLDHQTGWLYVCNSQQNRVIRINTATGTPGANATPHEDVAVYKYMDNFVWESYITTGLDEPTGIDIVGNHMIVSNYNTGDINLYDISGSSPIMLGVIPTGSNGIMGVKVGPDGLIWYVNSVSDQVMRVEFGPVSVNEVEEAVVLNAWPNPAGDVLNFSYSNTMNLNNAYINLIDISGRIVMQEYFGNRHSVRMNIGSLPNQVYTAIIRSDDHEMFVKKIVVQH